MGGSHKAGLCMGGGHKAGLCMGGGYIHNIHKT